VSHEYLAFAWLPFGADPAELERRLGRPVWTEPGAWAGEPLDDDLLVLAVAVDGDDGGRARRTLGFAVNVTLAFTDVSPTSPRTLERGARATLAAVAALVPLAGARLVLLEELNDQSVIAALTSGVLVLNREWPGWLEWPGLTDVLDVPHRYEDLRLGAS
jgi:hypothetical protein